VHFPGLESLEFRGFGRENGAKIIFPHILCPKSFTLTVIKILVLKRSGKVAFRVWKMNHFGNEKV
jgi:hypothetical protein